MGIGRHSDAQRAATGETKKRENVARQAAAEHANARRARRRIVLGLDSNYDDSYTALKRYVREVRAANTIAIHDDLAYQTLGLLSEPVRLARKREISSVTRRLKLVCHTC